MKKGVTVTRPRLLTATVLTGLLLAGPIGAATAEDESVPSGSPSTTAEAENQPPVAVADQAAVNAGESVVIPVLANDTDDGLGRPEPEEPRLEVVALDGGERFTFTSEDVTFTARAGDGGTYTASYTVSDGQLTASADITVEVTPAPQQDRSVTIAMAKGPVALRKYSIHGKVAPLTVGQAVVQVQRRTGDGWVGYDKDRTDGEGRYSVPFRTNKTGKRVFRAVAIWAEGPKARSGTMSRTVRAVPDVKVSGPLTPSQVPHSWRSGCPVPPSNLRKITINRLNYKQRIARGSIVVRAGEVPDVVRVFKASLYERFPIRMMKPADAFYDGGRRTPMESDKAAMRAGNTSAFNCRPVTGNPYRISQHSYGNAVDINTIENPYVTGSTVYPSGSREYLDRSPYRRGMILRGGVVASRMRNLGWLWGARWSHPDYQHFSSNGG